MSFKKIIFTILFLLAFFNTAFSQIDSCFSTFKKHTIHSENLNENREYWISLPMNYDTLKTYPVLYVLDAEWRFELIRNIEYDMAGNKKTPNHIIVGIPHIDWEYKRGLDLTFSQSRMEYDGEKVDSTWYNAINSGNAVKYYSYFKDELITDINKNYPTNGNNILVGHSYGGYFGAYLLSMNHPFSGMLLFDPSIWYSDGEVIDKIKNGVPKIDSVDVYITYQPKPKFHADKIEELLNQLQSEKKINLFFTKFENETHNSLYMYSFLEGMMKIYKGKMPKERTKKEH